MIKRIYEKLIPSSIRIPFYEFRKDLLEKIIKTTDPTIYFMSSRLKSLEGKYFGQRCFIMGNGPSLNKMNLDLLNNEVVWGSNRCYLLFDRISWRPNFYVAVDNRVVPDNAIEINRLHRELPSTKFFYPLEFRLNKILRSSKNVYWYNQIRLRKDLLPHGMFSLNPPEFLFSVYTVTVAMLQLAVYLGFNPIYLIGCDTSYNIPASTKIENGNSDFLISSGDDPNHFDPSYFGNTKKWHNPHVDRMIFHYEQAKEVCDEMNIKILNATIGGKLEVFPRVDYLDLFIRNSIK